MPGLPDPGKNIWFFHPTATPCTLPGLHRPDFFCRYLAEAGYAPTVFSGSFLHYSGENLCPGRAPYYRLPDSPIPYIMVKIPSYRGSGIRRVMSMLAYVLRLRRVGRKIAEWTGKPDVIIASSPHILSPLAGIFAARRFGCKCIVEIRDFWPDAIVAYGVRRRQNPAIWMLYRLEEWIYKKSDAVVFTKEGCREYIVDKGWDKAHGGSIDLDKVFYINNGVDLDAFDFNRVHCTLSDPDLEDPERFLAVYTGSIRHVNHLDTLVDAASILARQPGRPIRILVYGGGDERDALRERVQRLGLSNIVFKGLVENKYIPYILSKCDLALLHCVEKTDLNRYGTSLNKSFDYLAAGKPILANFTFGYDYITGNGCGVCETFPTAEAYADAIRAFEKMPRDEYDAMCRNARKTAEQYGFRVLTEKLIRVMETL